VEQPIAPSPTLLWDAYGVEGERGQLERQEVERRKWRQRVE
jgi:hypothetical protein